MALHTGVRPALDTGAPTQTQTSQLHDGDGQRGVHVGTLRLRGQPRPRPGVRWAEDVVDNSNMNKKKSKICCIYHKPREFGESSSESSSSSSSDDSDSDSEPDNSKARMGGKGAARRRDHGDKHHDCDHHDHGNESSASDDEGDPGDARPRADARGRHGQESTRRRSPNAYEKTKTSKQPGNGAATLTQDQS